MPFSPTWFLLQQEGYLAQSCLCNGLTALRKANIGDRKGLFYSAFFELSIGFERMMKLILILDHMARHDLNPPDGNTLRGYGHRLDALFDATKAVCAQRQTTTLDAFGNDSLQMTILGFLDDFADTPGRYGNINRLVRNQRADIPDPLVRWGEIAQEIMRTHGTPRERQRANEMGQLADALLGDLAVNLIGGMDQQLPGVGGIHQHASELETAAKHAIFALVTLIAALRDVIGQVTASAREVNVAGAPAVAHVPAMHEFFQFAWADDRRWVMRKMRWP